VQFAVPCDPAEIRANLSMLSIKLASYFHANFKTPFFRFQLFDSSLRFRERLQRKWLTCDAGGFILWCRVQSMQLRVLFGSQDEKG
jgi:hypothetical protein